MPAHEIETDARLAALAAEIGREYDGSSSAPAGPYPPGGVLQQIHNALLAEQAEKKRELIVTGPAKPLPPPTLEELKEVLAINKIDDDVIAIPERLRSAIRDKKPDEPPAEPMTRAERRLRYSRLKTLTVAPALMAAAARPMLTLSSAKSAVRIGEAEAKTARPSSEAINAEAKRLRDSFPNMNRAQRRRAAKRKRVAKQPVGAEEQVLHGPI